MIRFPAFLTVCAVSAIVARGQSIPNTWPHDYPGKPSGDFSPQWQSCKHRSIPPEEVNSLSRYSADFEVKDHLPNVTVPLTRSFAGNVPVNRAGHTNDTIFFWAFEKKNGSLTVPANKSNTDPWVIWIQGG